MGKKKQEIQKLPEATLVQPQNIVDLSSFIAIDRADEEAIMDELQGRITDKVCYSFEIKDKSSPTGLRVVEGIGWKGALQIAKELHSIGADPSVKPSGDIKDNKIYVMVFCRDFANNVGVWGASWQSTTMKRWNKQKQCDELVEDPFAFIKAMNKAQRNGILALIDETTKQKYINLWKSQGKVRKLESPKEESVETPIPSNAKIVESEKKTKLFG